jgi:hypothetical protein
VLHPRCSYLRALGCLAPFSQEGVESAIQRTKFYGARRISNSSQGLTEPLQRQARLLEHNLQRAREGEPLQPARPKGPVPEATIALRKRKDKDA